MTVLDRLRSLARRVLRCLEEDEPLEVPKRTTSNIRYDPERRAYTLGDDAYRRRPNTLRGAKKLAQMMSVAAFAKELVETGRSATLRELYYTSEGWDLPFKDQRESDAIVEDLEAVLGLKREEFGIWPEEDGAAVYGDLLVEEDGVKIHAERAGISGYNIPPNVDAVELLDCGAERVIAVETMGMYRRLVQERAHEKLDALIVGLKGQAARATRRLLRRLNEELDLPVYVFTDGDPYGWHIYMVIRSGSAKAAHLNHELACPDARFIGVTATDIVEYDLPTEPLTEADRRRIEELKRDPRYDGEFWRRELDLLARLGRKAEQQAFAKYSLDYVVEEYLPTKLEELE
ncbi:MAG: DNA topoisomerase IV subunit A [Euryarchaeota archaeon]